MSHADLTEILESHAAWLSDPKTGRRADLSGADLSSADLRGADLSSADLRGADLSGADLSWAGLSSANLSSANLRGADLSCANLSSANLSGDNLISADLSSADLRGADLRGADLSGANLSSADLRGADLRSADLRWANLSSAGLSSANLSSANLRWAGLSSADLSGAVMPQRIEIESDGLGWIAYKFGGTTSRIAPRHWTFQPGSILEETVHPDPCLDCACGINVATWDWVTRNPLNYVGPIWKVRMRWEWGLEVVVPYNSDGKFRCGKCELLEVVQR